MRIFWKVEWHPHPAKYGVPWCTPKRDAFRDGEGGEDTGTWPQGS